MWARANSLKRKGLERKETSTSLNRMLATHKRQKPEVRFPCGTFKVRVGSEYELCQSMSYVRVWVIKIH